MGAHQFESKKHPKPEKGKKKDASTKLSPDGGGIDFDGNQCQKTTKHQLTGNNKPVTQDIQTKAEKRRKGHGEKPSYRIAAKATRVLAWVAIIQLIASIFGAVVLLIYTNLTRQAAEAATRSADAATRNTQLTEEEFRISEEPQVQVTRMELAKRGGNALNTPFVTFENFGKSPAFPIAARYGVMFGPPKTAVPDNLTFSGPDEEIGEPLMPGQTYRFRVAQFPLSNEQVAAIKAGTKTLFIYGELDWKDNWGTKWRSGFCQAYDADESNREGQGVFFFTNKFNFIKKLSRN